MRRRTDDDFENGVLRPGRSVRVPLAMRDGGDWRGDMSRHLHRDVNDRRRREMRKYDPRGRLISTAEEEEQEDAAMIDGFDKPGFVEDKLRAGRTMTDADRVLRQAYADAERADAEAWRHLSSAGETHDGPKAGDQCTVREGAGRYGVEGSPGRLREVDGRLVCVSTDHHDSMPEPTGNAQLDAAYLRAHAITDATERAYEMRRLDDENAWRKPL
jgi:hypothetical protein